MQDVDRLLEFLADRDVACPVCGYNLRALTRPQCPECRQDLVLTVGIRNPRFLWFLVAITPCTFSGIAAALLAIPIVLAFLLETGPVPWPAIALDAFGWLSGLSALMLIKFRFAFLRQKATRQRGWALAIWAVHVAAFFVVLGGSLVI